MDVNVKVAVRCRPLSSKELNKQYQSVITINNTSIHVEDLNEKHPARDFTFDFCYGVESTQEQVFTDIGMPLIKNALEGYNSTIFAYGQTGSGKTHSMMGNDSQRGLIPRINEELFRTMKLKLDTLKDTPSAGETKCMITVSYLEIYNEIVKDLLNPSDKKLDIRENPKMGIYVDGLCELIVRDASDLLRLIEQGNAVRKVAATNMNEQSSRSHSCFTITIEQKTITELTGGVTREQLIKAKVNLVDLAGSERADKTGATGATLKEGSNINKSLSALGNVINALSEGKKSNKHIPYRDSKLTRLLQESLGGNSATVMIAAISPADYNYDETLSTLKYANRAKSIANAVTKNEDVNERMIRELKQEIEKLKAQLVLDMAAATVDPLQQQKLLELEQSQKNAWEEKERLSKALEEERNANMNSAISTVMETVKVEKINHLRNIKRINIEKEGLVKKEKLMKEKLQPLKKTATDSMQAYMTLQAQCDSDTKNGIDTSELVDKMNELLSKCELERSRYEERAAAVKKVRGRIKELDVLLETERGELMAAKDMLDQNDQLREKIQNEERVKAKEMIEQELAIEKGKLDKERAEVRGVLEADYRSQLTEAEKITLELRLQLQEVETDCNKFKTENKVLKAEVENLRETVAGAEGSEEALRAEVDDLNYDKSVLQTQLEEEQETHRMTVSDLKHELEELKKESKIQLEELHQQYLKKIEDEKYILFKSLMDGFQAERVDMEGRLQQMKTLWNQAAQDMAYLTRENITLKDKLSTAIFWEPKIHPSTASHLNGLVDSSTTSRTPPPPR